MFFLPLFFCQTNNNGCVNDLLMVIWLLQCDPNTTYTPLRDHPPENFLNLQQKLSPFIPILMNGWNNFLIYNFRL